MAVELTRAWSWRLARGAYGGRRSGGKIVVDGLRKTQAGHFKLEGRRVDCVRAGPECSWGGARARRGAGHHHDPDDGRLGAGADLAWGGGRGPPAAARRGQHFKFSSRPEVAREPAAEERVGRSQPRGWRCSGRAGRPKDRNRGGRWGSTRGPECLARHAGRLGAGTARGGAGLLADATPAPGRGPAPGRRCGQVGQRGLAPRRWTGVRSRTRSLARPAGRLGAGPRGARGRGKGWPVVGARPFPRKLQGGRGPLARGGLGR